MSVITITPNLKDQFNSLATHPLQSWQWGQFRKKTNVEIIRLARVFGSQPVEAIQMSVHTIPHTPFTIGYIAKSGIPTKAMFAKLIEIGSAKKCILIKLEPNVEKIHAEMPKTISYKNRLYEINSSPHPLFTNFTFILDLTQTEEELLKNLHPKTRYNIKVAQKHSVLIEEDNSEKAFDTYISLTSETTKRQHFYAHDENYHRLMWQSLYPEKIAHLLTASIVHNGRKQILTTWVVFLFGGILYYPYGASTQTFKNTMASNLMMWEAIKFGKRMGAKQFDMWGSLGPNPDINDPWYGFHRFKAGYGPLVVEFVGSFDLILSPSLYRLYNLVFSARTKFLSLRSYLR